MKHRRPRNFRRRTKLVRSVLVRKIVVLKWPIKTRRRKTIKVGAGWARLRIRRMGRMAIRATHNPRRLRLRTYRRSSRSHRELS